MGKILPPAVVGPRTQDVSSTGRVEPLKGSVRNAIEQGVEKFSLCYFAWVMATGIVPFFSRISYCPVYIALVARVIVFAGLIHRILRNLVVVGQACLPKRDGYDTSRAACCVCNKGFL
jgi:hypothetical protein